MATILVEAEERDLLELVLCAFTASEIESSFDLTSIERMPAPFPALLDRVRSAYEEWESLDFPYRTYPDGWESALLQR